MSVKIKPLGGRVLVKACEEKVEMIGGIILPGSAQEAPRESIVVALGTGAKDDNGKVIPFDIEVGDTVLTEQYGGTGIKMDGVEYTVFDADQIIAVITK